jgi:hypothetical protein
MSASQLELLRGTNENIENLEKALTQVFHFKDHNPKLTVIADMMIARLTDMIQEAS